MKNYEHSVRMCAVSLYRNQKQNDMENRFERKYEVFSVIQHLDGKWGINDSDGNEIVPFGKYDWIDDFDSGLARVKVGKTTNAIKENGNKWGIINEKGIEVLAVEYDNIWKFCGKDRFSTKVVKGGVESDVYFHNLNPELPVRGVRQYNNDNNDDDNYGSNYGEFSGSYAQDIMGYSDDVINDAFEGDPDNYWNID